MKNLFVILSIFFIIPAIAQDKVKVRFKIGKNEVQVNKVAWAKLEYSAGKYFLSTLSGEEFLSINPLEFGTGRYHSNTGKEIMHSYCEINFIGTDIPPFEVDAHYNEATKLMYKMGILVDDVFNIENARKYKEKYADDVSQKRFLTK